MCLANYRVMNEFHLEGWPESAEGQRCLDQCTSQMAELHDEVDELRRTLPAINERIESTLWREFLSRPDE